MAKPSVDGLERDLGDRIAFSRVDIKEGAGREIAARFGVRAVPTFLVVAPDGQILYRQEGGRPDRERVEAIAAAN